MEDNLVEYRLKVYDAIERGDSDRDITLWKSDIKRLTDFLLWVYNEWSKPMVYDKGNLIDFKWDNDPLGLKSIEKKDDDYEVIAGDSKMMLDDINNTEILRNLARLLNKKEFNNWDYVCDMVRSYQREFEEAMLRIKSKL